MPSRPLDRQLVVHPRFCGRCSAMLKLRLIEVALPLRHRFTIAHGSSVVQENLIVGAALPLDTPAMAKRRRAMPIPSSRCRPSAPRLKRPAAKSKPKRSTIPSLSGTGSSPCWGTTALPFAPSTKRPTICGASCGAPVYRLWGLTLDRLPLSDYTIGIDTIVKMVAKMQEFPDWPIYKIKLGTPDDLAIVRELRRHTRAIFRVDANCAWTAEQAVGIAPELQSLGVELIEQPLARDDWDGMRHVFARAAAGDGGRKLPGRGRCAALCRLLSRSEHQAHQGRGADAGAADDCRIAAARPEGHGGLYDRVERRHLGDRAAPALVGLRRHGRRLAHRRRYRHRSAARGRAVPSFPARMAVEYGCWRNDP